MIRPATRQLWFLLAAGCLGLVAGSIALTAWLDLHPCHLCIFQRLLFMGLAVFGLLAGLLGCRPVARAAGLFVALIAASGVAVAGYQSWLQVFPVSTISCGASTPGVIETIVEYLGAWLPALFLATGNCADEELVILGLSLANWAGLAFLGCLAIAAWALIRCRRALARMSSTY
jgi:disulfide bond formation protein DsbB